MNKMLALEELASRDTFVHRLHPSAKLFATAVYLVCVISVGRLDFPALSLFFFYPAVLIAWSGIPAGAVVRRVLPALPFVLFAGLSNVVFEPEPYLALHGLMISRGFISLVVLIEKTVLTVSAVLILMATTTSARLFACLRGIGVPAVFVTVLMLSVRYLSLLMEEAGRMARAYRLRSNEAKGIRMKDMGSFVGQMLLRSFDCAERVHSAMKLRGYDGSFPTGDTRKTDAASACFALAVGAVTVLFRFFTITDLMNLLF
ncbi:MAG TPA: cobalt ECF transporter T component CbiQ [Clostridia bacterium]|nr:cobalt ECF transporter T component CbiQ [Clostridia bacterium]